MADNDKWSVVVSSAECRHADYSWNDWVSGRDEILPEDIRIDNIETEDGFRRSYWVRNLDLIDEEKFVEKLYEYLPEARSIIAEHKTDYEEILIHLLVADIQRLAEELFSVSNLIVLDKCLAVISEALVDGDCSVKNAIQVSFIEDSCFYKPEQKPFIDTFTKEMKAEIKHQESTPGWFGFKGQPN